MLSFRYSEAGLAMTKQFEGLRLSAYQDCAGVWTVGYGHTGPEVCRDLQMNEAEAEALLLKDLQAAVDCVNRIVTAEIAQGHFDALVDFCFNLGERTLAESTLLKLVNKTDFAGAAEQFALWCHAGGKVQEGLVKRRAAEAAMFRGEAGLQ